MLIFVLVKGILMGLAIAAPVGPIALLCIRRTLAQGRLAGLSSGFGAATALPLFPISHSPTPPSHRLRLHPRPHPHQPRHHPLLHRHLRRSRYYADLSSKFCNPCIWRIYGLNAVVASANLRSDLSA